MKCSSCNAEMKPLAGLSMFCPNDCDRKSLKTEVKKDWPQDGDYTFLENDPGDENKQLSFDWDDEPTVPNAKAATYRSNCPDCGSTDIAPFDHGLTEHCWACGKIWLG